MISAHAYIFTRIKLGAALPYENGTRLGGMAGKDFDSQSSSNRITAIGRRTSRLFRSHATQLLLHLNSIRILMQTNTSRSGRNEQSQRHFFQRIYDAERLFSAVKSHAFSLSGSSTTTDTQQGTETINVVPLRIIVTPLKRCEESENVQTAKPQYE